jgi:hypothetical protein
VEKIGERALLAGNVKQLLEIVGTTMGATTYG